MRSVTPVGRCNAGGLKRCLIEGTQRIGNCHVGTQFQPLVVEALHIGCRLLLQQRGVLQDCRNGQHRFLILVRTKNVGSDGIG